ncbi:MAG: type II secretion system protein [Smithella sp.]|jgi:prepilin-type N-terminal cleavage/methylation domain-containing protein
MKKSKRRWNRKGFTIIESIITLLLISIMAVIISTFTQPIFGNLGAFSWFNDNLLLQQSMENIIGDYKSQRNDPNNPFNPSIFRQYVINNYPLIDASNTGFLTFTCSGTTCTAAWPPAATLPSGSPPVLIITVHKNVRTLSVIVT